MTSFGALLLVLVVYLGAAAFAYREAFLERFARHGPPTEVRQASVSETGQPWRLAASITLIGIGGVMVLAGVSLVLDTGNLTHPLPLSAREFGQLLKDIVPGMVSVVVGFLLLEASGRTFNGPRLHTR